MATKEFVPANKTEARAKRFVEDAIDSCPNLKAYFSENDRTPSWDGEIYVYKNSAQKKEDLRGTIPVQIKSRSVTSFGVGKCSYPLEVADLRNYLHKFGTIVFLVEINSQNECRLYYAQLLPTHLYKEMDLLKKEQKTRNIDFKFLQENRYKSFYYICLNFIDDQKRQAGRTVMNFDEIEELAEIQVQITTGPDEEVDYINYILENDVCFYGRGKSDTDFRPIKMNGLLAIAKILDRKVSIGQRVYFENYEVVTEKGSQFLKIGNNITFTLGGSQSLLSYTANGNLEERVRDSDFMLAIYRGGELSISDVPDSISFSLTKQQKARCEALHQHNKYLNDLISLFQLFRLDTSKFDISSLIESDKQKLNILISLFIYKREGSGFFNHTGLYKFIIGELSIAIIALETENNKFLAYDYFSDFSKGLTVIGTMPNGEKVRVSPYLQVKPDELISYSNFNSKVIIESIHLMGFSKVISSVTNNFMLGLLCQHDITKRLDVLELCQKINDFLLENEYDDVNHYINRYQINKRKRPLTKQEQTSLLELKRRADIHQMALCAINILLDNNVEAEYSFVQLTHDEQKAFAEYPIYNLKKW